MQGSPTKPAINFRLRAWDHDKENTVKQDNWLGQGRNAKETEQNIKHTGL